MMEPAALTSASTDVAGRRLTRLIWVAVLAVVIVALTTVTAPWTFSTTALRGEVAAQIKQATGLATLSQGRAVFALLPQPHIKIDQVRFGDPSGALQIDADYFKGNLRILPLLVGRLEIASAVLLKPSLVIDLDHNPLPRDSAIGRAADAKSDSSEAAAADTARLGIVSLVNGTARLKTQSATADLIVDDIDMTLDWRNLSSPASLTGKARVRGEFGDFAAWIARPAELLRGGRSEMTLEVKTDVLALTSNGTLSASAKPEYSGQIRASSPALPRLLELIGYPIARTSALGRFQLTSEAKATADSISFSNLNLRLAGSDFEGSLAIETEAEKPLLSGTLATDLLTLDPFLSHLQKTGGDDVQWSREPIDLDTLTTANLDIRVSATRARFAHFEMQDAALSLLTRANRVDISLAEAKAYRGLVKARASLALARDGIDVHAAASVTDLDVGALSWDAVGLPELTGLASGSATIEGAGQNLAELMQHVDGKIQVSAKHGDIRGADLARTLHLSKGEATEPRNERPLRVPYDQAQFSIKVFKGIAEVEQGLADGPDGHVLLSGNAVIPDKKFDLRAVILPALPADQIANQVPDRNILIKGPWDHPLILPAAQ